MHSLDGLDLEVQANEGKHQTLEILDKIVEHPQALWI
jgi:hypothetical protein